MKEGQEPTSFPQPLAFLGKSGSERPSPHCPFQVGDRVRLRLGLPDFLGTVIEDRGLLGARGRRLLRLKVEFEPPHVLFIEMPEEELATAD